MQAYATLTDQGVTSKIRDLRTPASDCRCAGPFRLRFVTMVVRDSCRSGRWRRCGWRVGGREGGKEGGGGGEREGGMWRGRCSSVREDSEEVSVQPSAHDELW